MKCAKIWYSQCRRVRGGAVKHYREWGPGADWVSNVFVFLGSIIICLLYRLALTHQAQVTL
jgi:hypothetical protein